MTNLLELREALAAPVPEEFISSKTIKGNKILYIAWFDICLLLDKRLGSDRWDWDVKEMKGIGDRLYLIGVLTIRGDDRDLSMAATGCEDLACSGYGDPSSNAEAMALRRAAAKMNLARDLWRREASERQNAIEKNYPAAPKSTPRTAPKPVQYTSKEKRQDMPQELKDSWQNKGIEYFKEKGLEVNVILEILKRSNDKREFFVWCNAQLAHSKDEKKEAQ